MVDTSVLPKVALAVFPDGQVFQINPVRLLSECSGLGKSRIRRDLIGLLFLDETGTLYRVMELSFHRQGDQSLLEKCFGTIFRSMSFFSVVERVDITDNHAAIFEAALHRLEDSEDIWNSTGFQLPIADYSFDGLLRDIEWFDPIDTLDCL